MGDYDKKQQQNYLADSTRWQSRYPLRTCWRGLGADCRVCLELQL